MQQKGTMRRLRNAALKAWLGTALAVSLLLAESFAFTHELDTAAHDNGQVCAVCVGAASLGAGAVSVPFHFEPLIAAVAIVATVLVAVSSIVPARRYARGPPAASF
jgi:hypothetical protein